MQVQVDNFTCFNQVEIFIYQSEECTMSSAVTVWFAGPSMYVPHNTQFPFAHVINQMQLLTNIPMNAP